MNMYMYIIGLTLFTQAAEKKESLYVNVVYVQLSTCFAETTKYSGKYCSVQDNNIRDQILFNQPQSVRPSFFYSFSQFMILFVLFVLFTPGVLTALFNGPP